MKNLESLTISTFDSPESALDAFGYAMGFTSSQKKYDLDALNSCKAITSLNIGWISENTILDLSFLNNVKKIHIGGVDNNVTLNLPQSIESLHIESIYKIRL